MNCKKCEESHDPALEQHVCRRDYLAAKHFRDLQNETQEQLIRRVIREEIQLAFPERYAAKGL